MIDSAHKATEELSKALLDFVHGREWSSAELQAQVFEQAVFSSCSYRSGEIIVSDGLDWPDSTIDTSSAAFFLRKEHLRTTGKRIWGLIFTLYPDGKYDIAYDYNKPEDYDDSDDAGTPVGGSPVVDLLGSLVNAPAALATESFLKQALKSLQDLTARNAEVWGLGTEAQWDLDMNAGSLYFTFANGRKLCAAMQVVGTYNTANGSFLWGWDHPSVPEPLRRAARLVHEYGQTQGIEAFTTRTISCTEAEAWSFTAAVAQLDGAAGAYRGDADGRWVYMVFEEPRIWT
nr:DUF6882 domain-containing protein [uncultured Rhodoferax sp.]